MQSLSFTLLRPASTSFTHSLRLVTAISISSFVLVLPITIVKPIRLRLVDKILQVSRLDEILHLVLQNDTLLG